MESRPVIRRKGERGQVMPMVALALAVLVLLAGFSLSYALLTQRAMRVAAVADVAAHAGAMEVHIEPDGQVTTTSRAEDVAQAYFLAQAPDYASLQAVQCGLTGDGEPYCDITATVKATFLRSATHIVHVRSVLSFGATRGRQ